MCKYSLSDEAFQSRRGKHFGMNRIYQKFPIIAQSSGFLIRDERKRARRNKSNRAVPMKFRVPALALFHHSSLKICIFNRLLSI